MEAFNSVLSNFFFFWMSHLFLFFPNTFLLVDMNGIITLPQSKWLNWLGTRIYICSNVCCGFPISFHCCLFLTSPCCLVFSSDIRHFSMISVFPYPPSPVPRLFSFACVFCLPSFPSILPLTARTCKVSMELNNTRKWLRSDLTLCRKDLLNCGASCVDHLLLRYYYFLFCDINDEVMLVDCRSDKIADLQIGLFWVPV